MFEFTRKFLKNYLPHTLELGRSFVAPEYQSSKAGAKGIFILDNLWDGILAVILHRSDILYFLGKMTIYPTYDKSCRELIQRFLWKHFPDPDELARPRRPVEAEVDGRLLDLILRDKEFRADYRNLKDAIRRLGFNIPPLVNSYMNLSPTMKMLGTGINDEFFDAYDTGILVCVDEIYEDKQERHRLPYFREMAQKMRSRFPNLREEADELVEKLTELWGRRRVRRRNKKEKVEP